MGVTDECASEYSDDEIFEGLPPTGPTAGKRQRKSLSDVSLGEDLSDDEVPTVAKGKGGAFVKGAAVKGKGKGFSASKGATQSTKGGGKGKRAKGVVVKPKPKSTNNSRA